LNSAGIRSVGKSYVRGKYDKSNDKTGFIEFVERRADKKKKKK
jgi:hypothetical protein